jgi:hypothetical protein
MLASSSWLWLSSFELHTNRGLRSGNRAGNTNITTQRQGGSWVGQKLGTIRVANEHHWNVGTSDRWLEWRSILGVDDHDTNGTMCNSNIDLVLEGAVASTNNKVLHTHTQPVHQLSMSELHVAPMQPSGVVHTLPATAAARVALVYRTQPCDAMGLVVLLGELARTKPAVKALVNVLILMLQLASTISNLTGAAVFIPIEHVHTRQQQQHCRQCSTTAHLQWHTQLVGAHSDTVIRAITRLGRDMENAIIERSNRERLALGLELTNATQPTDFISNAIERLAESVAWEAQYLDNVCVLVPATINHHQATDTHRGRYMVVSQTSSCRSEREREREGHTGIRHNHWGWA